MAWKKSPRKVVCTSLYANRMKSGPQMTIRCIAAALPDSMVDALAAIAKAKQCPRAVFIGEAVEAYSAQHQGERGIDVFRLWQGSRVDGLAYRQARRYKW
jgi:hypothetical protein